MYESWGVESSVPLLNLKESDLFDQGRYNERHILLWFVPQLSTIQEEHTEEGLIPFSEEPADTEDISISPVEGSFIEDVLFTLLEGMTIEEDDNIQLEQLPLMPTRHLRSQGPVEGQPHVMSKHIEYQQRSDK